MQVRITKICSAIGKIGTAVWNEKAGKFEVSFQPPWVGYYTKDEFEIITE